MINNSAPAEVMPVETKPVDVEPLTHTELEAITRVSYDEMCRVVVWDDDIHEFDYVVKAFVQYFKITPEIAFEKTWQIHHYGKATLDQGSRTEMEIHARILEKDYGLTATVEED